MEYILASASPRRKDLLSTIIKDFEVIPATGDEDSNNTDPAAMVEDLALAKAMEVEAKNTMKFFGKDYCIIGADTVVVFDNHVMGKPNNEPQAKFMLSALQGKTHQVYTGVSVIIRKGGTHVVEKFSVKTDVTFYPMDKTEIEAYVSSKEPMDKAGAYGIQGQAAKFIEKIDGDYNNVVGLPVASLYQFLKEYQDLLN